MIGLYVLLLLAIWLGLGYGGYRFWRRWASRRGERRRWYAALGLAAAAVWLLWPFYEVAGRKMYYDARVRDLCAKDGGVRVYETVKLPADQFDKWGMVKLYSERQNKTAYRNDEKGISWEYALGTDYVFKEETTYYQRGNPDLFRMHTRIARRYDGKILGESVFYKRGGGDFPGPWHGSSFMCPGLSTDSDILRQVFVKE